MPNDCNACYRASTQPAWIGDLVTRHRIDHPCERHAQPPTPVRKAMILHFADGHREYSPEIEVIGGTGAGDVTLRPIVPFQRIPEGEKNHA